MGKLSQKWQKQGSVTSLPCYFLEACRTGGGIRPVRYRQRRVCADALHPRQYTNSEDVPHLQSDHEEADTRLLLHAADAQKECKSVVIKSTYTDVIVLGIFFSNQIANLVIAAGTKQNFRLIDVKSIRQQLGETLSDTLPGVHAVSGCDFTSSFAGKGKRTWFTRMKGYRQLLDVLGSFGTSFQFDEESVKGIERAVCSVYGCCGNSVNEARFFLFSTSGHVGRQLPPTLDALTQHTKRAWYQTAIWKSALVGRMATPSPEGYGWTLEEGELKIVWMLQLQSSDS